MEPVKLRNYPGLAGYHIDSSNNLYGMKNKCSGKIKGLRSLRSGLRTTTTYGIKVSC